MGLAPAKASSFDQPDLSTKTATRIKTTQTTRVLHYSARAFQNILQLLQATKQLAYNYLSSSIRTTQRVAFSPFFLYRTLIYIYKASTYVSFYYPLILGSTFLLINYKKEGLFIINSAAYISIKIVSFFVLNNNNDINISIEISYNSLITGSIKASSDITGLFRTLFRAL